ncbi:related to DNA ligase (ATP) [Cephalotrichum gorgonifer]|uniref:DNA ligase n=1 Tax=Cephalotrichum gorgonifer TaxID=2041049 RepID=A0AAE8N3S8_9PEZI|nr:related to DNA ligase (ATP) [Cephalotrichum gorgonifer]
MSSPSKRRKLDTGSKKTSVPSRGLEYFFSKQRQQASSSTAQADSTASNSEQTDEDFARKLQAEFDKELLRSPRDTDETSQSFSSTPVGLSDDKSVAPDPGPTDAVKPPPIENGSTLRLQSSGAAEDSVSSSIPLDESPFTFEPAKYIPQLQRSWESQGGNATYALLARCFTLVNGTQSRIKIVDTLVNCMRILIEGDPSSLLPAVWLATNAISPPYISLELGLGGSAISKALKQVCGLDNRTLKSIYDRLGDAGDVAFEAKKKQSFTLKKPKPLTIQGVYQALVKIASTQGQGSAEVKQRIVDKLLQDARGGEESRYIVRTLCQHLRIGAVKTTMLIALSRAFLLSKPPGAEFQTRDPKEMASLKKEETTEIWSRAEEIVKACFAKRPNYNDLVPALLDIGVCDELRLRCCIAIHVPLRPMLGSITRDLSEMLTKVQGRDFACEFKYDGQRAQVHCDENGKVSIFSRHLELMTDKYPDLVALIPRARGEGLDSFIMEGEVVAVDANTGELKNFQTLTNRARKDVEIGSISIQVCLFAFDLMYINGESLLSRPFRERRELLRSMFIEVPNRFTWVKNLDATSQDPEAVLKFFKSALENKCEGIMVKVLDNLSTLPAEAETAETGASSALAGEGPGPGTEMATPKPLGEEEKKIKSRRKPVLATYEPDKRLDSWLKVKKDYSASSDTLDLIPIGAWHGQGRKAKWWSPILLAVRNEETGSLEAVCKCMSGFTDTFYKANREWYDDGEVSGELNNTRIQRPGFVDYSGPEPDVWFEPQEVWETAFADITLSPTYTAALGLVSDARGLSLRFPRFLKKREDKGIEEASTNEFLASLYRKQEARAPTPAAPEEIDEE